MSYRVFKFVELWKSWNSGPTPARPDLVTPPPPTLALAAVRGGRA